MQGTSTPATRAIESMRRFAARLKKGLPPKPEIDQVEWLLRTAEEFERVNNEMQRRHRMDHLGAFTGLQDRNGNPIYLGDKLRFDPHEWGGECEFTITFRDGELCHPGSISDLSEWCELIDGAATQPTEIKPAGVPIEPNFEPAPDRVIWGARAIGKAINRNERVAYGLLESGQIPGAKKVGGRWCVTAHALRRVFNG